jgi:peptidyl-prolyl cis-trans isomerase B (cyclophilin B)
MFNLIIVRSLLILLLALVPVSFALAESDKVKLSTNLGDIVIELSEARAPESVKNFKHYVSNGFYKGTIFHRVIDGFMIQGGGYTADFAKKDTANPVQNEANNGLKNDKYTISMARTSSPHSATSQFFINTSNNEFLNHTGMNMRGWGYTVFGRVIAGHDIIDKIGQTATGSGGPFAKDVPTEAVTIQETTFIVPNAQ